MASDPNRRPTASHDKSPGGSVDAVDTPDASYHPRAASARGAERRTRTQRRDAPSRDTASDEATAAFVRRVLCGRRGGSKERVHARPIEELLPPLTSSNEVDLELYAVVAVVVREFVDPWYADFTSDRAFVDEVVGIVAHCTRALEQRMREVDVEALLLDEMPALVDAHVSACRVAREPLRPPPLAPDPRRVYHGLLPHPALSPVPDPERPATIKEQQENESAYRQLLVQGALALLLPTEDFENACVRTLVAEVLGEMIVGNAVGGKLCEGRFWMEVVVKLVDLVRDDATGPGRGARASSSTTSDRGGTAGSDEVRRSRSRPGWNGAGVRLVFWQLLQHLYSFFLVLRFVAIALSSCSSLPPRTPEETSASSTSGPQAPSAREFPATSCPPPASTRAASQDRPRPSRHRGSRRRGRPGARPILRMRIWSCLSNVAHLTRRMPWLEGALKLVRHGLVYGPGGVADTDGIVDRILSHHVGLHIRTSRHVPRMIRLLRTALFPGHFLRGARPASPSSSFLSSSSSILAPSTTAPAIKAGQTLQRSRSRTTEYGGRDDDDDDDDDDAAASLKAYSALKRRCAAKITSLVPGVVRRVYLSRSRDATEDDADRPTDDHAANTDLDRNSAHDHSAQDKDDTARDHAHDAHDDDGQDDANPLIFRALSYLDDAYVNKHLCYAVVELLVVRLLPELAEQRSLEHLVRARVGVSSVSSWT